MGEMAVGFEIPVAHLKRFVRRHGIEPACLIGRTRVYGPIQVKRVLDALCLEAEEATAVASPAAT
jgi:hypothetical protein